MDDKILKTLSELTEKAETVIHLLDGHNMSKTQADLLLKLSEIDELVKKLLAESAEKAATTIHLLNKNDMSQPQKELRRQIAEAQAYLGQNPTPQPTPVTSV